MYRHDCCYKGFTVLAVLRWLRRIFIRETMMGFPKHSFSNRYGEMVGMTIRLPKDLHQWIV
jgi:hypothetical protein